MAILCVATANFEKNYFQQVDRNLQARHYLLTHWEDFFKGYTLDAPSLTAVNITNPEGVIEDLRCQVGVGGQLGAAGAGDDPAMRKLAVPLAVVLVTHLSGPASAEYEVFCLGFSSFNVEGNSLAKDEDAGFELALDRPLCGRAEAVLAESTSLQGEPPALYGVQVHQTHHGLVRRQPLHQCTHISGRPGRLRCSSK